MHGSRLVRVAASCAVFAACLAVGFVLARDEGTGVPAEIPAEAKSRPNPQEANATSVANGRMLFSSQCVMCHGATGDGQGDLVARLGLEVPDFTDPARQKQRTDGELFYIVTHGHGRMQGEGDRLDDKTKWNLVNYVRSLAKTE